jgi:hypothetical protein
VYRNLEQLNHHLAAPLERLGKSGGCKYVTSAAPGVQEWRHWQINEIRV